MDEAKIAHLMGLGLNRLEAEVYIDLLQHGSATGYATGKRLGKATANVYKAIDHLAELGAVVIEASKRQRLCRPLPIETFIKSVDYRFQSRKEAAERALRDVTRIDEKDNAIFNFETASAVISQARTMLGQCQKIAVLDLFPEAVEVLKPDILALAARGPKVFVQVYAETTLKHCHVVTAQVPGVDLPDLFQGVQFNVVVDAEETLLALLSRGLAEVKQAVWSKSIYLSFMMHIGLMREHNTHQLLGLSEDETTYEKVQEILAIDDRFSPLHVPGIAEMMNIKENLE